MTSSQSQQRGPETSKQQRLLTSDDQWPVAAERPRDQQAAMTSSQSQQRGPETSKQQRLLTSDDQ
jgi:hypothetical protein